MNTRYLACIALSVFAGGICRGATIEGRVTERGSALKGTTVVTFFRIAGIDAKGGMIPATGKEAGPASGAATPKADGSYRIEGLGPGHYQICIVTEGNDYLDPCTWQKAGVIALKSDKDTAKADLALETGARLELEFEDRPGLLARKEKPGARSAVRAGIRLDNGAYVPIRAKSSSESGIVHELVVPREVNLHLQIETPGIALTDERGVNATAWGRTSLPVFMKKTEALKRMKLSAAEDRR